MNENLNQTNVKLGKYSNDHFFISKQKLICYFQTNDNLELTARLLYLIQADFLLLFSLHFIGKIEIIRILFFIIHHTKMRYLIKSIETYLAFYI